MKNKRTQRKRKLPHEIDKTLTMLDLICPVTAEREQELLEKIEAPGLVRVTSPVGWDTLARQSMPRTVEGL